MSCYPSRQIKPISQAIGVLHWRRGVMIVKISVTISIVVCCQVCYELAYKRKSLTRFWYCYNIPTYHSWHQSTLHSYKINISVCRVVCPYLRRVQLLLFETVLFSIADYWVSIGFWCVWKPRNGPSGHFSYSGHP